MPLHRDDILDESYFSVRFHEKIFDVQDTDRMPNISSTPYLSWYGLQRNGGWMPVCQDDSFEESHFAGRFLISCPRS